MSQYYYLISSLPFLQENETPPITINDFFDLASMWMSQKDFRLLKKVSLQLKQDDLLPEKRNSICEKWITFENSLRNELAQIRAKNLSLSIDHHLNSTLPEDPSWKDQIRSALQGENPLVIEKKLLSIRWEYIDQLSTGHYFDLEALIIYSIKLQILHRLASFNEEKGQEVFEKIYKGNIDGNNN